MIDGKPYTEQAKQLPVVSLKKYTLCQSVFCRNINAFSCVLKDVDIIFLVFNQLELTKLSQFSYLKFVIMIACKIYENNIIFSISENVMHHFRKSKILFISLKFSFSSVQTVYVFIIKYLVPVTYLPSQIYFLK